MVNILEMKLANESNGTVFTSQLFKRRHGKASRQQDERRLHIPDINSICIYIWLSIRALSTQLRVSCVNSYREVDCEIRIQDFRSVN